MTDRAAAPEWYAVRCVFRDPADSDPTGKGGFYEERVTIWQALSHDDAIAQAEAEAEEYCSGTAREFVQISQSFCLFDPPAHGSEVFSLIRHSELAPKEYLDAFFDTGAEIQAKTD